MKTLNYKSKINPEANRETIKPQANMKTRRWKGKQRRRKHSDETEWLRLAWEIPHLKLHDIWPQNNRERNV